MTTRRIRTLVAWSGIDFSYAGGEEIEVEAAVAEDRIAAGLAEPAEPPAERETVKRAGRKAETAALKRGETRG